MRGQRVLGVFAHPDDEAYAAAGLFSHCTQAGAQAEIVCATRGEAGGVRDRAMLGGGSVAELRSAELASSCSAMGAAPPRFLGWPDGGVAALDRETRAKHVAAHLDRFEPHIVATLGRDGAYGHADHIAVTESVLDAAAQRPGLGVRVLLCQFPRGLFTPLMRLMRRIGVALAPGIEPEALGIHRADADFRLGLAALARARAAKLAALTAHRSQRPTEDPRSFLRPGLIDPLLEEEWYTVAAGPPIPSGARSPFAGS